MKIALLFLFTLTLVVSTAVLRKPENAASELVQGISQRGPVHMIRFVISEDGLYPRRMQVDRGLLNIALEDKTGRSESLLIESLVGDRRSTVGQVRSVQNQGRGRALIELPPGRYLVSDSTQQTRTAELIVNP